jgi:hypothetical protein
MVLECAVHRGRRRDARQQDGFPCVGLWLASRNVGLAIPYERTSGGDGKQRAEIRTAALTRGAIKSTAYGEQIAAGIAPLAAAHEGVDHGVGTRCDLDGEQGANPRASASGGGAIEKFPKSRQPGIRIGAIRSAGKSVERGNDPGAHAVAEHRAKARSAGARGAVEERASRRGIRDQSSCGVYAVAPGAEREKRRSDVRGRIIFVEGTLVPRAALVRGAVQQPFTLTSPP